MLIQIPFIKDKELQGRFEAWLTNRGNGIIKQISRHAVSYQVEVADADEAFWIGVNYCSLLNKLFDGPLTTTLHG